MDTELPNEVDEYINSIEDPQVRQQRRWLIYLERVSADAWGDHIAVQGLADMLHVDINVVSTINPDMKPIRTSHHTPIGVIYLGLIGQFHYQALEIDRHPTTSTTSQSLAPNQESSSPPDPLNEELDKEDEEAFNDQVQLKGLPYDSFM